MTAEVLDLQIKDWMLKLRLPPGDGPHPVIFLIHGWTGDEGSMWIFAPRLPKNALLIAPRAPYISKHPQFGGYSWVENRAESFSRLPDFDSALEKIEQLVIELSKRYEANFQRFGLAGFSQGAAFCFAFAMLHPRRVSKVASLAGFLPTDSDAAINAQFKNLPIFIAHGTKDETVPVEMAQDAKKTLEQAGAKVQYCEADIGHKLGANCFTQLAAFFADV